MFNFSVSQSPFEAKIILKLGTPAALTIININEAIYANSWKQIPKFLTQDKIAYYSSESTLKWHWLYAHVIVIVFFDAHNRKVSGLVNSGCLLLFMQLKAQKDKLQAWFGQDSHPACLWLIL